MATIELGPGSHYVDPAFGTSAFLRRPLFPTVRWGAVFAGIVVGITVQLVLTLLGVATGLSALDVMQGERPSMTGPLLWAGLSMLISVFASGYVAARLSGLRRQVDGALHGAVAWAVITLTFSMLTTFVSGSLLSGIFNNLAPVVMRDRLGTENGSEVSTLLRERLGSNASPTVLLRLQRDIQAGRRDDAIALLVDSMAMERTRATTVVDQALILSGSPEQASPQSRAATGRTIENAGTAAWVVFFAIALALATGIGGGVLGVISARRAVWDTSSGAGNNPA